MSRRSSSLAFGLVAALLTVGSCDCGEALAPVPVAGTLWGVVCDEGTGLPSASRDVRFEHDDYEVSAKARTDEAGEFTMEQLPPGEGGIVVSVDGIARRADVTILEDETTLWVDPACRPGVALGGIGDLVGQVCNRHVGELVQNAQVRLPLADGSELATATDDAGWFELPDVPAGQHVVHVTATGFSRSFLVEVRDGETTEMGEGEVCTQNTGNQGYLTGELCDPSYAGALMGARVWTRTPDGTEHTDVTDTSGAFVLGPLDPGSYEVHVARDPDVDVSVDAVVTAGMDTIIEAPFSCQGNFGPPGGVVGRLCSPNGEFWLADATVWVETDDGERFSTTTDSDGEFTLEGVPPGDYVLHVDKGAFHASFDITVEADAVTVIPEDECEIVVEDTRIAVVQGSFDSMETVITNLGIDVGLMDVFGASWADQLLGNYDTLQSYDVVIINCGAPEPSSFSSSIYKANLRQWVEEGGSLYASDWAYDIVEAISPSHIEFLGDDLVNSDAQKASNTGDQLAQITDLSLSNALGSSQVTVKLWAPWAIMDSVAASVRVYIRGPAEASFPAHNDFDAPYTVGFDVGAGRVLYTSWHQEPGINLDAERVLQILVFEL